MSALEEQLAFLKTVGIELKPDVTIDDLLKTGLSDNEPDAYTGLLTVLGSYDNFSNDIFCFDAECINGSGSYIRIARRMATLSDGAMPLETIQDAVYNDGTDEDSAWLFFVMRGKGYKWYLQVNDDWLDSTVFSNFVELHDRQKLPQRFIFYSMGQGGLIAYATPEQLAALNQQTGLEFTWLT